MPNAQYSGPFDVARITGVAESGRTYFAYPNGRAGYFDDTSDYGFVEGQVLFLDVEGGHVEPAPEHAWPGTDWVGVVKHRTEDDTVVEVGGRLVFLDTNEVEYEIDNTVLARDGAGVIRVLADTPIRTIDLGLHDEPDVERRFRMDPSGGPTFGDYAGMEAVKRRARELVELPLAKQEQLKRIGAKPIRGVLFTGDPGTGKTMLARIIAREAEAAFYLVSGPQVNSKWFGESEETVRSIFKAAAKHPRSIIFFDEIDSVAGSRTGRGSEAQRSVVTQLLAEMDGFAQDQNVMVIAATNRPDDIDRALRRPGRFDSELHFPLPDPLDRLAILESVASKHRVAGTLPLATTVPESEGWSSAELAGIFTEAALLAAGDDRDAIAAEDYVGAVARAAAQHARRQVKAEDR